MKERLVQLTRKYVFCALFVFTYCLLEITHLHAAKLKLSTNANADTVVLVLKIDKIEKLAGMKLSIDYPNQFLQVKTSQKGATFNSFMQVVNDKNPGKIIMVMASATGVSGENIKLFEVTFTKIGNDQSTTLEFKPTECQLMSESLQSISCDTSPASFSFSKSTP